MRLIDIDSQFIASLFPDHHPDYQTFNLDDAYDRGWEDALDNLEDAPTIDAVPVVRCRECRRFLPYTAEYKAKVEKADGDCGVLIFSCIDHQYAARQVDDFCSYGQRKEDGHGTVQ